MNDIFGLGKILPVDKLIDLLSKTCGAIAKPYLDRRDVDTEAYKIEKLAQAQAKAMEIISDAISENSTAVGKLSYNEDGISIEGDKQITPPNIEQFPESTLEKRALARLGFQETRNQLNIESVVRAAAEELKLEQSITDTPVDEDWATRFFKYSEGVSDEGMQAIWGKILAGEIKNPSTYSLRTLETLRNLTKHEAEVFLKAANLAFKNTGQKLIYKGENTEFLEKFGLYFLDIASLRESGLLHDADTLQINYKPNDESESSVFLFEENIILAERQPSPTTTMVPVFLFTQAGHQLLNLVSQTTPLEYLNSFADHLSRNAFSVQYSPVLERDINTVKYDSDDLRSFPMPEHRTEN